MELSVEQDTASDSKHYYETWESRPSSGFGPTQVRR